MACFGAEQLGEGGEASAGLPCLSDVGGARPALRSRRLGPLRDIPPRPAAEAIAPRLRRRPYGLEDLPGRTSSAGRQHAQSLPRNWKDRAQAAKEDGAAARGRCPAKPRDLRAATPSQKTLRPGGKPGRRAAGLGGAPPKQKPPAPGGDAGRQGRVSGGDLSLHFDVRLVLRPPEDNALF